MKKFLNVNANGIALFSVIFSAVSFFITFDVYCKNQITPETPLLNIAGLPFLRMDFVLIIFSAAFIIGALLSTILKKCRGLLPFVLGVFGCIALFIALFDVNTMQIFAPTMRISHVIMTVSRVIAIVFSVSGICVGAAVSALMNKRISKTAVVAACLGAVLAGVIANAQNLQTVLYFVCAVLLLISSLAVDFSKDTTEISYEFKFTNRIIFELVSVISFTVLFGVLYSILCENAGFGEIGFTAVSGIILAAMIIVSVKKLPAVLIGCGLFIGSVISFSLVHFASEVLVYSGNRVIYVLPYGIGIACLAVCIIFTSLAEKDNIKKLFVK